MAKRCVFMCFCRQKGSCAKEKGVCKKGGRRKCHFASKKKTRQAKCQTACASQSRYSPPSATSLVCTRILTRCNTLIIKHDFSGVTRRRLKKHPFGGLRRRVDSPKSTCSIGRCNTLRCAIQCAAMTWLPSAFLFTSVSSLSYL